MSKHMMPVSEVPFDELRVGDEVVSYRGNAGVIIEKVDIEESIRFEDNSLVIRWDNGKENNLSYTWHFWCSNVYMK